MCSFKQHMGIFTPLMALMARLPMPLLLLLELEEMPTLTMMRPSLSAPTKVSFFFAQLAITLSA